MQLKNLTATQKNSLISIFSLMKSKEITAESIENNNNHQNNLHTNVRKKPAFTTQHD